MLFQKHPLFSRAGRFVCAGLFSVCVAGSLRAEKFGNFIYTDDGTSITIDGLASKVTGAITIPSSIAGKPVTDIADSAFSGASGITSLTIPASVTTIAPLVFTNGCPRLTSISVDAGNPEYSSSAGVLFDKSKSTIVAYPAGKTDFSYTIPATVTSIDPFTLGGASALTSISVAAGNQDFTSDGGIVFDTNNTLIVYPPGKAGAYVIPSTVGGIDPTAFFGCKALTSVTISSNVDYIDPMLFTSCSALTSISVAVDSTSFSSDGAVLFDKSKTILLNYPPGKAGAYVIPSTVTSIRENAFSYCKALTGVIIPSSVSEIGTSSFIDCMALKSVTISSGVTTIGGTAFFTCKALKSVTIPASVTDIGDQAFQYTGLKEAIFLGDAPPTFGTQIFDNTGSGFKVKYLAGKAGFTSPTWNGYPAELIKLPTPVVEPKTFQGLVGVQNPGDGGAAAISGFLHVNGQISLTVTAKDGFTGSLLLDGKTTALRGTLDANGTGNFTVSGLTVSLVRDNANPGGTISGNVKNSFGTLGYTARPVAFTGKSGDISGLAGKALTASLLGTGNPQASLVIGHGFSAISLDKDGSAKFVGKLPDGSKFTGSARAVDSGNGGLLLPVAILIPSTNGILCGALTETETQTSGVSQLDGSLAWLRAPAAKDGLYPNGLLAELDLAGSIWNPEKGTNLLSGNQSEVSFTLHVDPNSKIFAAPISQQGTWPATNKPKPNAVNPAVGTLTVSPKTGLFSGKAVLPPVNGASGKVTVFQGVLLSNPINAGNATFVHGVGFLPGADKAVPVEVTTP